MTRHRARRTGRKKPPGPAAERKFTDEEQKLIDAAARRFEQAVALRTQGQNAAAEKELRVVIAIRERVLGPEHPATLKSRNNLANALHDQGQYAEAEREHRALLAIKERVLGAEHPHVFESCYNLALSLEDEEKLADALAFARPAAAGLTDDFGGRSPAFDGCQGPAGVDRGGDGGGEVGGGLSAWAVGLRLMGGRPVADSHR